MGPSLIEAQSLINALKPKLTSGYYAFEEVGIDADSVKQMADFCDRALTMIEGFMIARLESKADTMQQAQTTVVQKLKELPDPETDAKVFVGFPMKKNSGNSKVTKLEELNKVLEAMTKESSELRKLAESFGISESQYDVGTTIMETEATDWEVQSIISLNAMLTLLRNPRIRLGPGQDLRALLFTVYSGFTDDGLDLACPEVFMKQAEEILDALSEDKQERVSSTKSGKKKSATLAPNAEADEVAAPSSKKRKGNEECQDGEDLKPPPAKAQKPIKGKAKATAKKV